MNGSFGHFSFLLSIQLLIFSALPQLVSNLFESDFAFLLRFSDIASDVFKADVAEGLLNFGVVTGLFEQFGSKRVPKPMGMDFDGVVLGMLVRFVGDSEQDPKHLVASHERFLAAG